MSDAARTIVTLQEYRPQRLSREVLTDELAEQLWRQHGTRILVDFPSPTTGWQWQLTPQGIIGHIPVTPSLALVIEPKVPVRSIFAMLAMVMDIQPIEYLRGLTDVATITETYEQLAELLARRVLRRCRDGLVRAYVGVTDELSVVRGSVNVRRMAQQPWSTRLECRYEEHTADIDDNQILAWTLFVISRSGICRPERTLPFVQQALRLLQSAVEIRPIPASVCQNRRYHRLNADYAPLHALCRLFLEHTSPLHSTGDRAMVPFLLDTALLYERCVAGWLQAHLPLDLVLIPQQRYAIGNRRDLRFVIDLVLMEAGRERTHCVLDTKYKRVEAPSTDDIAQVVAYAQAMGCQDAFLVYPQAPARPLDARIGNVRVQTVVFDLREDLNIAGNALLAQILSN